MQHLGWRVVEALERAHDEKHRWCWFLTEKKYEHECSLDADGRFHRHMPGDLFRFLGVK